MNDVIYSQGLTRRFGKRPAVFQLDLAVKAGKITAFLGPNGAGKTTTIRLLLGLLKADEGKCEVLGLPPGDPHGLSQVGAMVESPALYDHLNGHENLEITRLLKNAPRSEVDRVLKIVGLQEDAKRPIREYSLGMRQRLGVALALMGEPKLLILDEPTNGLDPEGIKDMRELILSLPRETGTSIFISSHILAEVEQVASDVVVIHRGSLRYQGAMEALGIQDESRIWVRTNDAVRSTHILGGMGFKVHLESERVYVEAGREWAPKLASELVKNGLDLYELTPWRASLESRFLALLDEK